MSERDPAVDALSRRDPTPELESAVLGRWLLEQAGLPARPGLIAVAVDPPHHRVPFAAQAQWIAFLTDRGVGVAPRDAVQIEPRSNLAGEPRDQVGLEGVEAELGQPVPRQAVWLRGALVRAGQMAGALQRIAELSIQHAQERTQFGRPIASFQAVQAHLVTIAQQASLVAVAFEAAADPAAGGFEIAAAKLLANRAALTAGRAAHQVHGAVGTTLQHPLAADTRRLWAWRGEFGTEAEWSSRLGAAARAGGADQLYPAITGGSNQLDV